ncbi:MAG: 4Fe-4S dicluster domain-containing protein [Candidatus Nezhaarchaeales archaeon]
MVQRMLIVDPEKCTGCRFCEAACSMKHEGALNPARARIYIAKWEETGVYTPMVCQHCENPVCEAVCPMKATRRDPSTGAMIIDYDKCIGCRMCVMACPIGGAMVDPKTRKVVKCDLCNGDPVCVKFCETKALQFLEATVANMMKRRQAVERLSELMKALGATSRR